jgi:hypothetical protein
LSEDGRSVVDDSVDTGPLLQGLSTGSEHQSVKKWLCRQESLVFEHGDSEVDIIVTISLLGGFSLDQSLGLKSSELELDVGRVSGPVSQFCKVVETFLLSTFQSQLRNVLQRELDSPLSINHRGEKGRKQAPTRRHRAGTI